MHEPSRPRSSRLFAVRALCFGLVFGLSGLTLPACGPFGYIGKVSKGATRAVAEAEAAGAEELAPYEYWAAVTYLEQARVLMGYSEYERAFDYGSRAEQLADAAKRKAERVAAEQATASGETSTEPAVTGAEPAQ